MSRRAVVLIFWIFVAGIVCLRAQDPRAVETIRVETRLVSVPVIVSDRNGRYVPNLTAADFTILQDGKPQAIEFFGAVEEPLTIALLIDTSQSTRPVLDDIKDSARSFIKLLMPKDRAMIVSFDYDVHVLSPLTADQEQLKKAIKKAEIPEKRFGTMLRDAAFQTIDRSFAGLKGRKAVIILTDGKDVGSRISSDELLYSLQETDTLIYSVMFKTGLDQARLGQIPFMVGGVFGRFPPPQNRRGNQRRERMGRINEDAEEFLQEMSDISAGRFFSSKDGKLKSTFVSIVEELRFQYRLGFYPPEESGENTLHTLKVKVARPETVVRARSSYRVQGRPN